MTFSYNKKYPMGFLNLLAVACILSL